MIKAIKVALYTKSREASSEHLPKLFRIVSEVLSEML
jgi:hypothetical protein